MLKLSVGFFIVMLVGALASGAKKSPAGLGSINKETSSAQVEKGKPGKGLTSKLTSPAAKPTRQSETDFRRTSSSRDSRGGDSGFAGHTSSSKSQGFPGFEK